MGSNWELQVSEWLFIIANFSAISRREQVHIQWNDDDVRFVLDQHAEFDFYSAVHWSNNSRINMSQHSDTLSWFRVNQSLLFLLNAGCLAEKQQIPILLLYSLTRSGFEPTIYPTRGKHASHNTIDAVNWELYRTSLVILKHDNDRGR